MKIAIALAIATLAAGTAFADTRGDEIARKYYGLAKADDTTTPAVMTIIDKSGVKKTRRLNIFYRETSEGKDAFMEFVEPADVAGTKFLTLSHRGSDSEQRLYLPALKKTRKISSSGKDGEFVNSDLFYYDLEDKVFSDYSYTFIADDLTIPDKAFDGMKFSKIEMKPAKSSSPYAKEIAYANQADGFFYKIECYDKKDGSLLKTILFVKVQELQGVLVPVQTLVANNKKGSKTLLVLTAPKLNTGVAAETFSVKKLEE